MKQRGATIRSLNGRTFYLKNTNKMLWDTGSREIIGKTGYTRRPALLCRADPDW